MALPQRVLVIGSSSIGENGSGTLGQALRNLLSSEVIDLTFIGKSGAGFNHFAGTAAARAALEREMRDHRAQLVLVVMGGNPTGTAVQLGEMMTWLKNAVGSATAGAKLLWVGPPVYKDAPTQNITKLYDNIGPRILGSSYASSQSWTSPTQGRTSDGVHFTDYGAHQWGEKIVEWMRTELSPAPWAVFAFFGALGLGAWLWFRRRRRNA